MTKQQAYELAEKEILPYFEFEIIQDRSMEIYAGAFAEWTNNNYWGEENEGVMKWFDEGDDFVKRHITAELITKFEKI